MEPSAWIGFYVTTFGALYGLYYKHPKYFDGLFPIIGSTFSLVVILETLLWKFSCQRTKEGLLEGLKVDLNSVDFQCQTFGDQYENIIVLLIVISATFMVVRFLPSKNTE